MGFVVPGTRLHQTPQSNNNVGKPAHVQRYIETITTKRKKNRHKVFPLAFPCRTFAEKRDMFYLKDKAKTKTSIDVIVRFKGERYKIPTGESVEVAFWNSEKERCGTGRKYPDGVHINNKLDVIESDVKRVINDYNLRNDIPTPKEFKEAYDKLIHGASQSSVYFTDYMTEHINESKKTKAFTTTRSYTTTLNKLLLFEKFMGKRLKFSDIDIDFYNTFRGWFFETANTKNYFGTMIKNIKTFMNDSLTDQLHSCEGHKHPKFKVEQEDADTVYLSMEELQRIHDLKITEELIRLHHPELHEGNIKRKMDSLILTRSKFLIGAYTLLRVSDYKRLSDVNVTDGVIRIKPKKRSKGRMNRDVVIPMHPVVKEILNNGFDLTTSLSEQKLNKHIKELCRMVGINQTEIVVRTEKGKEVERHFEKWELITSHTARRSAATNMLMAGIEASDIMILGNWNSEKSFWKYIRLEPEINAKRLSSHRFFKDV